MRFARHNKSTVDTLFLLALLGVFLVCALFVVLFGARIYKKTTADSDMNFDIRTSAAYITEKVRRADIYDISVTNGNRLEMREKIGNSIYVTYLYFNDNHIKEVTMLDTDVFSDSYGTDIVPAKSFNVEEMKNDIFKFTITTEAGKINTFYLSASENGGMDNE